MILFYLLWGVLEDNQQLVILAEIYIKHWGLREADESLQEDLY